MAVSIAAAVRGNNKKNLQYRHRQLTEELGLAPKTKHSRLQNVPTQRLPCLVQPYPPSGKDICETEEIASIWKNLWKVKKHPDTRGKESGKEWAELEFLDERKLGLVVGVDESVLIRDLKSGGLVAVVIRNFARNGEVLDWVNGVIDENVGLWRGIRVCCLTKPI